MNLLSKPIIEFISKYFRVFFISVCYFVMGILYLYLIIQFTHFILIGKLLILKPIETDLTIYKVLKDIAFFIFSVLTSVLGILAYNTYVRSAKNQEFTNILTKRNTLQSLYKCFREDLYNALWSKKFESEKYDMDLSMDYKIIPFLRDILNKYESILNIYFESDENYQKQFDSVFKTEISEFLQYKLYNDLLGYKENIIINDVDYTNIKQYIQKYKIPIGGVYEIH